VIGLLAVALALAAGGALARNEWRLAGRLGALDAAAAQVTTLDPALAPPDADPARPVWLTGPARAEGSLRDPLFPAATADALRLDRLAETRQWREIRESGSGGDRNTRYEEVWSAERIDSALFERRGEHANPAPLPLEPAASRGRRRLGRHRLSPELLAPLPATSAIEPASLGPMNVAGRRFVPAGDWLTTGNPPRRESAMSASAGSTCPRARFPSWAPTTARRWYPGGRRRARRWRWRPAARSRPRSCSVPPAGTPGARRGSCACSRRAG
jgi:hypothetical protein